MAYEQDDSNTGSDKAGGKRTFRLSNGQILLIVLIILGIQMAVDFSKRIVDGQEKIAELSRLQAQVSLLEAERRQLETEKAYHSSESYVIQWAHSEGKMILPGEMLVIPVYDQDAPEMVSPSITVGENTTPPQEKPFALWWSLFFDSAPPFSDQ